MEHCSLFNTQTMEKNTFILSSMLNDVKNYPMTNSTEALYNSITQLNHVDLLQLFHALLGEELQHIQISRDWNPGETYEQYMSSKPHFEVVSCPRSQAQDAIDQQAWEEECARQDDYYNETA